MYKGRQCGTSNLLVQWGGDFLLLALPGAVALLEYAPLKDVS